jgi:hypothetical protein
VSFHKNIFIENLVYLFDTDYFRIWECTSCDSGYEYWR